MTHREREKGCFERVFFSAQKGRVGCCCCRAAAVLLCVAFFQLD